MMQYINLNH